LKNKDFLQPATAKLRFRYGLSRRSAVSTSRRAVLGVDGVPDFNALPPRKHDQEVQFHIGK
jgi:hypothetical protein